MTRQETLNELLETHSVDDGNCVCEHSVDSRYLLIEQSNVTKLHWFTTHDSSEAAAMYHDDQEYVEDWRIIRLVDLDTRAEWEAETTTRWMQPEWSEPLLEDLP